MIAASPQFGDSLRQEVVATQHAVWNWARNMSGSRILVVDDDVQIRRLLYMILIERGYTTEVTATGHHALHLAATWQPDAVLLDLGLPDIDGLAVCRRIREWSQVPIIIISVRADEAEKVQALDEGADDYLTKPFGVNELLARLRAALRRSSSGIQDLPVVEVGDLRIDFTQRQVRRNGKEIHLTPKEYELLRLLVRNAGKVVTQNYLLREVWGTGYQHDAQTLRVFIGQLRRKIEPEPAHPVHILTEIGVGYRFNLSSENV